MTHTPELSGIVRDVLSAQGTGALGDAHEVGAAERDEVLERYLRRHPDLESFARAPDIAVIAIDVLRFVVVRRLKIVEELTVASRPRSARERVPR